MKEDEGGQRNRRTKDETKGKEGRNMNRTMKIDKETRDAIALAVRQAQLEAAEVYGERWVTGAELCQMVSMFTKEWLDNFGWKLPRERIEVTDDEGRRRVTRWGYPLHQIQRMIREGRFRA